MLNKKQIDQLFLEKLKDYEKDPPVSLWNNIEKQINRGNGNISYLTFIAVAAAVLTLFLSGWWLSDTDHSNQYLSQSNDLKRDAPVEKQIKVGSSKEFKPSVFSMGTFAPTNSFTAKKESHKSAGDEPVSLDLESKIISRINSDERLLKQITNLISPVDLVPVNYKKDRGSDETDTPDPKENERKWNLKIQGGPVFTGGIKDASGLRTHPENTFSGGITVGYAVTKKLSVESGMIFNQIKQRNEIVDQAYSNPIITPSGKVSANEWSNSNAIKPVLKQELSYISVPVLAHYKIVDKKIKMGVTGGINIDLLAGNKAEVNDSQLAVHTETSDIRDVAYSGEVGLELGYEIGKRITLTVEPRIKQYINSLSSNSAVNFKPFQVGLITGLSYSFN
jgi:hypothetical protein